MNYTFPYIMSIDEVLPYVKDLDEFIVVDKGDYVVINYVMMSNDTFPPVEDIGHAIRRECRGLVFSPDGRVAARRIHKFFNAGEREETMLHNIDVSKPHVILEKLDGSMITPIPIGDSIRWGTKMGITDIAMDAEAFVATRPHYHTMAMNMTPAITPIFEFCTRKHRFVVDHPEDRLVLIAARYNTNGEYFSYDHLLKTGKEYGVEVVGQYPGTLESMESLVDSIRAETEGEGWVIRFDDGHMVKIKNTQYVRLHKVKDRIRWERNLMDVILNGEIDDLKAIMTDDDRLAVEDYEKAFWSDFINRKWECENALYDIRERGKTRKEYVLEYAPNNPQYVNKFVFNHWEKNVDHMAYNFLKDDFIPRNLTNNKKFKDLKKLFPSCRWQERGRE